MQNVELLTVRDILDDDYGCEELPLGAEPMVTVILTDDHGAERSLRLADSQTRTWAAGRPDHAWRGRRPAAGRYGITWRNLKLMRYADSLITDIRKQVFTEVARWPTPETIPR